MLLKSSSKVQDHFHIPLQSGDDNILKEMRRKYTVADYKKVINKLIAAFPNAGIGADMIVGFPGETKEQFENTFNLARELPLTHFHIFPYSKREGTPAAKMPPVNGKVIKERAKILRETSEVELQKFLQKQIGKKLSVIMENGDFSKSENFLDVKILNRPENVKSGDILEVRISAVEDNFLLGEL